MYIICNINIVTSVRISINSCFNEIHIKDKYTSKNTNRSTKLPIRYIKSLQSAGSDISNLPSSFSSRCCR